MAEPTAGQMVAAGVAAQAAQMGVTLNEDAQEFIAEVNEEAAEERGEEIAPEPTAGEQVIEGAEEEMEEKLREVPSYAEVSEEELAEFDEDEVLSEAPVEIEDEEEDLYAEEEEEDVQALKRRLHKAEKTVRYQKELRAKSERSRWEKEAGEKYPLANISGINVQSRNAFLKAAALSHNDVYSRLKPHLEELDELRSQITEQAKKEGRQAAAEAWGKPTSGPTVAEVNLGASDAELDAARKTGNLEKVLKVMRKRATAEGG